MAVKKQIENGRVFYEVYVNGFVHGKRFQRRQRRVESLRKAEDLEFEYFRELAKLKDEPVTPRWDEWYEKCIVRMDETQRPSTVKNYKMQLRKWTYNRWYGLELVNITREMIHNVLKEVAQTLSPHSGRTILKMIRRVFQMAVDDAIIKHNPCAGLKVAVPEADQKVLTNSEAQLFLREAKLTNHRFYPIWTMALGTGMRSGELMGLIWTNVDLEGKNISVVQQWTNKTGFVPTKTMRSRTVPISEDLSRFLKELKLKAGAKETDFVLPHLGEWDQGAQAKVTREFCEMLGITQVKFHDLRATFITNLLSRGVPLVKVMAIVGHNQLATTTKNMRKAGVEVRGVTDSLGYKIPSSDEGQVLQFDREKLSKK